MSNASKFTPRPWRVHKQANTIKGDADGRFVADLNGVDFYDALLILAAPDLYAACEAAISRWAGDDPVAAQLRAALAKARGES